LEDESENPNKLDQLHLSSQRSDLINKKISLNNSSTMDTRKQLKKMPKDRKFYSNVAKQDAKVSSNDLLKEENIKIEIKEKNGGLVA
jgi:hypothetical protein